MCSFHIQKYMRVNLFFYCSAPTLFISLLLCATGTITIRTLFIRCVLIGIVARPVVIFVRQKFDIDKVQWPSRAHTHTEYAIPSCPFISFILYNLVGLKM